MNIDNKNQFLDEKNISLIMSMKIITRQFDIFQNRLLTEEDINSGQIPILLYLYHQGESCQYDIARSYKIDKGAIARSIKKLKEKDFITKITDENNRRKDVLTLTPAGLELAKRFLKLYSQWEDELCSEIDINNDKLRLILKKMAIISINMNR